MEDLFWVIFVVIFVVGPILEKIRKRGAGNRPPQGRSLPGQRPQQRRVPQRLPGGQTPESRPPSAQADEENAADLLPADLWEMLTGQRPSPGEPMRTGPRLPDPAPPPEPEWEEVALARQAPAGREPRELRDRRAEGEQVQLRRRREVEESRTVRRELPVAVSLETTPLPESRRHAEFHGKLDKELAPVAKVEYGAATVAFRIDRMGKSELQRAILLREILDSPQGLE